MKKKPDIHHARMLIQFADKVLSENVQHNHIIVAAEMLKNAVLELSGAGSGGAVVLPALPHELAPRSTRRRTTERNGKVLSRGDGKTGTHRATGRAGQPSKSRAGSRPRRREKSLR